MKVIEEIAEKRTNAEEWTQRQYHATLCEFFNSGDPDDLYALSLHNAWPALERVVKAAAEYRGEMRVAYPDEERYLSKGIGTRTARGAATLELDAALAALSGRKEGEE